jgi:hypothetical protein
MARSRPASKLSSEQITRYHADGYLVVPGLLRRQYLAPLAAALDTDETAGGRIYPVPDGDDIVAHDYAGWTDAGTDLIGTLTRLERIVGAARTLIGEPIYHYHSKLVRKRPRTDSEIIWHQDFGGWYQDGCLFPKLLTCIVALTPATRENGCLKMMRGSQLMGRIDRARDQRSYASIYPPRRTALEKRFEVEAVEMAPGDALFFHANTVHASEPNRTGAARVLLEFSYNAVSNPPVFERQEHHLPRRLEVAPDESLRKGAWDTVFGRTEFIRIDDPSSPGASIFHREGFPDLS